MRAARLSDSGEGGGLPDPPPRGRPPVGRLPVDRPPMNKMTDVSENITLPQTSFAFGNKVFGQLRKVTRRAKCYEILSYFVHKL